MYYYRHEARTSHPGDAPGMGNAVTVTAITGVTSLKKTPGETGLCIFPIIENIPIPDVSPYDLFRVLGVKNGYILESMEGLPRRAVRSIVGLEPDLTFTIDDSIACEGDRNLSDIVGEFEQGTPLSLFRKISDRFQYCGQPGRGFTGGLVGYCSYDLVHSITGGMVQSGKDDTPFIRLMLSTRGIVYDHVKSCCTLFDDLILPPGTDQGEEKARACERLSSLREKIRGISKGLPITFRPGKRELSFTATPSREAYEGIVRQAKEHIMAGDIFQVVLCRKISCPFPGDPLSIYGSIRAINPSPYLYYLHFGDEAVIGSSPEMLVRVVEKTVTTVPIAGTRPRGNSEKEDDALGRELLADEKERAEHLMLVDLARNDIGRISSFGSVSVPEFYALEKFSHVQHIVSRVEGTVAEGLDRFDALSSCFPAGTVSGAPKIRAMQIIADLEGRPRGLYAGAVGYAGFNELFEFAIAIRTLRVKDGVAEFSTGAGIVADSVPEKEFEETEFKARAMVNALARSGDAP
jgi:anthranilate synthase component I